MKTKKFFKGIFILLFTIGVLLPINIKEVSAAGFSISVSSSSVVSGNTFTVYINGDVAGRFDATVTNGTLTTDSIFIDNAGDGGSFSVVAGSAGTTYISIEAVDAVNSSYEEVSGAQGASVTVTSAVVVDKVTSPTETNTTTNTTTGTTEVETMEIMSNSGIIEISTTLDVAPIIDGYEVVTLTIEEMKFEAYKHLESGHYLVYEYSDPEDGHFYLYDDDSNKATYLFVSLAINGNIYGYVADLLSIDLLDEAVQTYFEEDVYEYDGSELNILAYIDEDFYDFKILYLMDSFGEYHLYQYDVNTMGLTSFNLFIPEVEEDVVEEESLFSWEDIDFSDPIVKGFIGGGLLLFAIIILSLLIRFIKKKVKNNKDNNDEGDDEKDDNDSSFKKEELNTSPAKDIPSRQNNEDVNRSFISKEIPNKDVVSDKIENTLTYTPVIKEDKSPLAIDREVNTTPKFNSKYIEETSLALKGMPIPIDNDKPIHVLVSEKESLDSEKEKTDLEKTQDMSYEEIQSIVNELAKEYPMDTESYKVIEMNVRGSQEKDLIATSEIDLKFSDGLKKRAEQNNIPKTKAYFDNPELKKSRFTKKEVVPTVTPRFSIKEFKREFLSQQPPTFEVDNVRLIELAIECENHDLKQKYANEFVKQNKAVVYFVANKIHYAFPQTEIHELLKVGMSEFERAVRDIDEDNAKEYINLLVIEISKGILSII